MIQTVIHIHADQREAMMRRRGGMAEAIREALDAHIYPDGVPEDVQLRREAPSARCVEQMRRALELRGRGLCLTEIAREMVLTRHYAQRLLLRATVARKRGEL